jgi:hypothetical protein
MPVLGKNAGGILNQRLSNSTVDVSDTSASAAQPVFVACRTSILIKEVGFTIVQGTAGTNSNTTTTNAFTVKLYAQKPGGSKIAPLEVVTKAVDASQTVGSEFTTRDATAAFGSSFENLADRVFPKGTKFWAQASVAGTSGDQVVAYIQTEEFGAPPA